MREGLQHQDHWSTCLVNFRRASLSAIDWGFLVFSFREGDNVQDSTRKRTVHTHISGPLTGRAFHTLPLEESRFSAGDGGEYGSGIGGVGSFGLGNLNPFGKMDGQSPSSNERAAQRVDLCLTHQ